MLNELLNRAVELHRAGALEDAARLYDQLLERDPTQADAWNLRGAVYCQYGNLEQGVKFIEQAIRLLPGQPSYHSNLGETYRRWGRVEEARECFLQALRLDPWHADALNNLGVIYQSQGKLQEAAQCYERVVQINPRGPEGYSNLGTLYERLGEYAAAAVALRRAIELRPNYAAAWNNLGAVHIVEARFEEARKCLMRCLELEPSYAEGWNNLGTVHQYDGEFTAAIPFYERALELSPGYDDALRNVASCYRSRGDLPTSKKAFAEALRLGPCDGLRLRDAVCIAPIPTSSRQITDTRRELISELAALEQVDLRVSDPVKEIGLNHFYLAYQGYNDRDINMRLAALYKRACELLRYVAPHCRGRSVRSRGRPLRVGFVSAHFHQHSVGRLMAGLIAELPRQSFHVTVVRLPGVTDEWSRQIDSHADAVLHANKSLPRAIEQIAEREFDVLLFTDIGMDPLSYFLAFARLAPVQAVMWGHPVTSGIPAIDYFISSHGLEPENADSHYSEQLVRLSDPPTYFYPLPAAASRKSRADYHLDPHARWYLCAQSLFKIHPQFDPLLGRILSEDPQGHLILIASKEPAWCEALQARFRQVMPAACDRIHFLPRQSTDELVRLIELADVVLDTIHFSGGLTTLEALAVGQPVVSLPGEFMRGRVTLAYYRQIGFSETIAQDAEDYVRLALRLAHDPHWRDELRKEILGSHGRLFKNSRVVLEMEQFLREAFNRASDTAD